MISRVVEQVRETASSLMPGSSEDRNRTTNMSGGYGGGGGTSGTGGTSGGGSTGGFGGGL